MKIEAVQVDATSDPVGLDLFFKCVVDAGYILSCPYHAQKIDGYIIHNYNNGEVVGCFASKEIPENILKNIANKQPKWAFFKEASFKNETAKEVVIELFRVLSSKTEIRVV